MKSSVIKITAICFAAAFSCWGVEPIGTRPVSHQTVDAFSESAVREFRFREGSLAQGYQPMSDKYATIR